MIKLDVEYKQRELTEILGEGKIRAIKFARRQWSRFNDEANRISRKAIEHNRERPKKSLLNCVEADALSVRAWRSLTKDRRQR